MNNNTIKNNFIKQDITQQDIPYTTKVVEVIKHNENLGLNNVLIIYNV